MVGFVLACVTAPLLRTTSSHNLVINQYKCISFNFKNVFVQRCAMYLPLFWNCCLKGKFKIYLYSHVLQLSRCAAVLHRSQSLINTMKISAVYNTENKIMRIIWDILAVMMMMIMMMMMEIAMLRGWFFHQVRVMGLWRGQKWWSLINLILAFIIFWSATPFAANVLSYNFELLCLW